MSGVCAAGSGAGRRSCRDTGTFPLRLRPAQIAVTIASLAIVAIGSVMWKADRSDAPVTARTARTLQTFAFQSGEPSAEPPMEGAPASEETPIGEAAPGTAETQASVDPSPSESPPPLPDEADVPTETPAQPDDVNEGIIVEQ